MPRSRFLTRIRSSIAINSSDGAESDSDSALTDEISLNEMDFGDIDANSLPAQDPNPKRDSETTKVASTHNSYCKKAVDVDDVDAKFDTEAEDRQQNALDAFEKNGDLRDFAAQAAKSRRKRFRDDIDDVETEAILEPESSIQKANSPPALPAKVNANANLEQELRLERVESWVPFTFNEPEEYTETETPPPPPPKDRARAETRNGKLKRVLKQLFCIGSDLVSVNNFSRIQLPLTQNNITGNQTQAAGLLSFRLAFGSSQPAGAREVVPHTSAPSFRSRSRCD